MDIRVITYNMGMGVKERTNNPIIANRDEAFTVFAAMFSAASKPSLASSPSSAWFICVQEIFRNYNGKNQVEELQSKLEDLTEVPWYKNSNTHPADSNENKEAVAIFSNIDREKEQKWTLPGERAAQAYKVKLASGKYLWVVTTHLIKAEKDVNGDLRTESIDKILQNISTFDQTVPVVLCGDMNVMDPTEGTYYGKEAEPEVFNQTIGAVTGAGFTRGENFLPQQSNITVRAWNDPPNECTSGSWSILDYILVKERGKCTAKAPAIINYSKGGNCSSWNNFASDHKGLQMAIDYP